MSKVKGSIFAWFPLASILTIIFVCAKILGKITWSWWWVFSPAWITWAASLLFFFVGLLCFLLFLHSDE